MRKHRITRPSMTAVTTLALAFPAAAQDLALMGGNVIDVRTGESRVASVMIRDGTIERVTADLAVPSGARGFDASGRWIIPGLVEMHTHTTDSVSLRMALALGVTSTLTIYTDSDSIPPDWESASHLPGHPAPRMYLVGGRFRVELPAGMGQLPRIFRPTTPAEAAATLDTYRAWGFRRIKIWLEDGSAFFDETQRTFDPQMLSSIVSGARARGMEVYIHAVTGELFRRAVAVEPTWIVHPMVTDDLTASDVEALKAAGLGWTTTLSRYLWNGDPRRFDRMVLADPRLVRTIPPEIVVDFESEAVSSENPNQLIRPKIVRRIEEYLSTVTRNTRLALEGGLTLTIGSDHTVGYGTHIELEVLQHAGFDPITLLRAATLGGAEALGVSGHFGTVSEGKVADLVILTSDPRIDVGNLRDVETVLKGGRLWRASDLLRR